MLSTTRINPIVFFDGTCVLCHSFFKWLLKRDSKEKFSFATLQSPLGVNTVNTLKISPNQETIVLKMDDQYYTYSSAVLKILIRLGGIYALVGYMGIVFPKFIRDTVYHFISKNRYRIFGQQACMIPDKELKSRFID